MPGRVHTRRQFALLAAATHKGRSGPLRISYCAQPGGGADVAFAISRQSGNAVRRNRLRRQLRALFDHLTPPPPPGLYLVRCGTEIGTLTYGELHHHLTTILDRFRD